MSPYSTTSSSSSSSSTTHEGGLGEGTAEKGEANSTSAEGICKFLEVPTVAETQLIPDKEGLENRALQTLELSVGESQEHPIREQPITKPSDSIDQEMASPRRVFDVLLTGSSADSDSTGSSESVLPDELSSPVTEATSSNSQWRSVINGLLHRKNRKSRIRDKAIRRLSTFPPAMTEGSRLTQWFAKTKAGAVDRQELKMEGSLMLEKWKPSWRSFSYQELVVATDNFSSEKLIGKGGHAQVYRGCTADGQLVAVKRLMKKDTEERVGDFLSELGVIAHVNHRNAACLLGFGVDGGLHLVLNFSPHGSLASALHGSSEKLGWQTRFKIALGVAEGLLYLHKGCHRRIIHRDIKASNILLTEDYEPQISDFGLAKWLPERWNHHVVFPIEGTFGYLAPEYFMHGIVSEKTDVFAFGVLLLELITGRRAVDSNRQSLVIWAKPLLDAKDFVGLIDPCLEGTYDLEEMDRTVSAASACVHHLTNARPYMEEVVRLLRGEDGSMLKLPASIVGLLATAGDPESEGYQDYTSSKYLSDLNRHKQLALEQ